MPGKHKKRRPQKGKEEGAEHSNVKRDEVETKLYHEMMQDALKAHFKKTARQKEDGAALVLNLQEGKSVEEYLLELSSEWENQILCLQMDEDVQTAGKGWMDCVKAFFRASCDYVDAFDMLVPRSRLP